MNFLTLTSASLLTSVFEQAWRWLQAQFASWFDQPKAAALLSEPPAGRVWRSYYFVGSQRIALREQSSADPTGQVSYLLSDHLGSTTALVSPNGVVLSGQRYSSWGKTSNGGVSTAYQYTGQRFLVGESRKRNANNSHDRCQGQWLPISITVRTVYGIPRRLTLLSV